MTNNNSVLIVDDDPSILQSFKRNFHKREWDITVCDNGTDAISLIKDKSFAVIISDVCMPKVSGITVLKTALELCPDSVRIILSGLSTLDDAIEAINTCKADQFLVKPCNNESLSSQIEKYIDTYNLKNVNAALQEQVKDQNEKLKNLNKELLENIRNKHKSMLTSWKIQSQLLLDKPPETVKNLQVCSYSVPAQELNGDFVLFHQYNDHLCDLVVGDVMGKGISAALQGAAVKSSFQFEWGKHQHQPSNSLNDILSSVAEKTVDEISEINSFISMFYCRINTRENRISFIDCGSTKPFLVTRSGDSTMLNGEDLPFGLTDFNGPYTEKTAAFPKDSNIIFYSDGITEANGCNNQKSKLDLFGEERLEQLLIEHCQLNPYMLGKKVLQKVSKHTNKQGNLDDFTMVIIKNTEEQSTSNVTYSKQKELDLYSGISSDEFEKNVTNQYRWLEKSEISILYQILTQTVDMHYNQQKELPVWISIKAGNAGIIAQIYDYGQSNPDLEMSIKVIDTAITEVSVSTDAMARNWVTVNLEANHD